jgi:hypothetical protein
MESPEVRGIMEKSHKSAKRMRGHLPLMVLAIVLAASFSTFASDPLDQENGINTPHTILTQNTNFDRNDLFSPGYRSSTGVSGFSFLNPNRFSMRQSYSVNFASGSLGASSAGLYLNTLSYKLANPLTLSADVGFYSPLYSSAPGSFGSRGIQDPSRGSSLVLPRLGLEYKPTKNTTFSIQLLNGQDAVKAYGSPGQFLNPWIR